ncbi:hypothetical protein BO70DRAFT_397837 [Aspergillus heteromorphus CBS 117.55]|uniref:Nuclear membrane fusion protein Kar5 n=1 Tax=Aspergillus heteromorphus CBS 117.55 TaxID=1448321 RepID=A0A317VRK4_9EURO|nr:uncharacterized protein BO70DRAFT_397837 [Aspergillus heteromorphus CBS 117.55]PWY76943.1 hypothetical protein BO70DRAFT_397837 [Aspergillus heteromorphus CBS 117.55]
MALNSVEALSTPSQDSIEDVDLLSLLNSKPRDHDVLFAEALGLLESMKSSPSCNRMATSKMVTSCQTIGGKPEKADPEIHVALDRVRSIYAARLAMCELKEAGAAIPSPCISVSIQPPPKRGIFGVSSSHKPRSNDLESIPKGQLESCLKLLESRPQWWTSYSNSRQNAVVICQAARIENEKAELLELYRSIVQGSVKLDHGLHEAMEVATAETSRHKTFMQAVEEMRIRLVHEMDKTESHLKATLERVYRNMEAYVTAVLGPVSSAIERMHDKTMSLERNIGNASSETEYLRQLLKALYDESMARNEQMASTQLHDVSVNNELVSSLKSSLETLLHDNLDTLSLTVQNLDSSLEWLSGKFVQILQQEQSLSERLQILDTSLSKSQLIADELRKVQLQHNEAMKGHSQVQEHLQTNIRISQALLDKTAAAAANLQAMIDETTIRYKESPTFGVFPVSSSTWTAFSLLIGLIGAQNPRLAIIVLAISISHFITMRFL